MNNDPKISVNSIVTWLTILTLLGGGLAFIQSLGDKYVTKEELEIIVLQKEKERLEREAKDERDYSKAATE